MAKLGGKWACTVATPMGDQAFTLQVSVAGDRFHGKASGGIGTMKIEGSVDGDTLSWAMAVPKPMPLTLTCRATVVEKDVLEGKVKAGLFGSFDLKGARAVEDA